MNNSEKTLVMIPGVHMNDDDRHSFLIIAYENISHYYRFPFESFSSSTDEYIARVAENVFSYDKIFINVQPNEGDDASESFQINLTLTSHVKIPDLSWIAPGTMGPFSWIPTLQCYHHVLSMKYDVSGTIQTNENIAGTGYLEKDWGMEFPSIWTWGQANQWQTNTSASLFFSFALIPWYFNLKFPGYLVVFEYNHEFYRFNTYLQSSVHNFEMNTTTNTVSFDVYDVLFRYKLHVQTHVDPMENVNGAMLYGPRNRRMEKYVKEILGRNIYFDVRLSKLISNNQTIDSNDPFIQHGYVEEIIFEERAINIGLEITGDTNVLKQKVEQMYENVYPWNFSLVRNLVSYFL